MIRVSMTVNGKAAATEVDPRTLLVQYLRENLRLTGTHVGCDTSQCMSTDARSRLARRSRRLARART
jgi:aerobic-type carbon monoxide dehydrogenase small subunit (CoxS/CutS family)